MLTAWVDASRVSEGIPGLLHPYGLCTPFPSCSLCPLHLRPVWGPLLVFLGSIESPGDWPPPANDAAPHPLSQTKG